MADGSGSAPLVAHLHPNRGPGIFYGALAALVLAVVLGATGSNLVSGHLVIALVVLVVGLGLTGFLVLLCAAILGPTLVVGPDGVRGRVSVRQRIDLAWDEVGVDVDPDRLRGHFQLDLGVETFEVHRSTWVGFDDLVLVLATTNAALARMSTAAVDELVRVLDVEGPSTSADVPES